ncbi:CU044_5270 family protein [Streptomyces stelliscabiei]
MTTGPGAPSFPPPRPAPRPRPETWPRPALWLSPAAAGGPRAGAAGPVGLGATHRLRRRGAARDDGTSAVVLLDRIADVAAKTEVEPVRDDQLVYVKSLTAGAEAVEDGPYEPGELHRREVWVSQEPGPVKQLALHYEGGAYSPLRELLPPGSPGVPAGIDRPTYRWLASLPTDPDDLLAELYRLTRTWKGEEKAQAVFDRIGELLGETVMPARTAAALYEAAARIPG